MLSECAPKLIGFQVWAVPITLINVPGQIGLGTIIPSNRKYDLTLIFGAFNFFMSGFFYILIVQSGKFVNSFFDLSFYELINIKFGYRL